MPVILLRHTRPAAPEGTCYGRTDLGLAPSFAAEAAAAVAALPPVSAIVSSPLSRCLALAERVAAARGLGVVVDPRLAEMDFGAWEMTPWAEVPRAELDAWAADFHGARPHGGENVAALEARVRAALADAPAVRPPALWVAHSGIARAAAAILGRAGGWDTHVDFGGWIDLGEAPPAAARPR